MMLALTKSYNAYIIFKKCQVDVAILIDPTHTREEFDESITIRMNSHLSHNAVSNVLLPPAFVAQDYSVQISELRDKRKTDSLINPSRKAKRAVSESEVGGPDESVKRTTGGKTLFSRNGKQSVTFAFGDGGGTSGTSSKQQMHDDNSSSDDSDDDGADSEDIGNAFTANCTPDSLLQTQAV
jgi:hypothetical protein